MNYSEPGFEITLSDKTLEFSGSLEKADYTPVDTFLKQADQAIAGDACVIDMQKLSFLNSSGIKALATFILGSPKTFEVRINPEISWQKESIPTLTFLKNGITIVS
jgi:hypothetical protein